MSIIYKFKFKYFAHIKKKMATSYKKTQLAKPKKRTELTEEQK